ncbi:DUF3244 domain-containing protein [Dysgonomonas termitidis]|uniref:DUF3244 domain-containing protein n=1 Tax=Dysgonomonas termitidis TaxID=1516126 RepID=A0ABV9L403_9BACT
MRTKIYFLVFIMLSFGGIVYASDAPIDLKNDGNGEGGPGVNPRRIALPPITATLTDNNSVEVTFTANAGLVDIVVKDINGTVYYESSINTSQSKILSVDVNTLPADTYIITIKNRTGTLNKYGSFEID